MSKPALAKFYICIYISWVFFICHALTCRATSKHMVLYVQLDNRDIVNVIYSIII